ncbi:MAG: recombinase family protein, partial [Planctomycetaceae bacterium]|nr:recombinase family protein [Planctomycetaceae bacterium]
MKTVEVRPTEVTPERIATEAVPAALAEGSDIGVRSGSLAASEDRTSSVGWRRSSKIRVEHLWKLAIVYVRQSSAQQVIENRESTARQYALAGFAKELGWASSQVLVIDEDQGRSGASAEHRTGFQRLLAEVTLDHVGLVLGLEMSRLARSNKDWHHLLELCAIFGTLLADQDGVYDPSDPNDRLLLGLKGTMSEVELHTMRNRLNRGKL